MYIFVKDLKNKTHSLEVKTIEELKYKLNNKFNLDGCRVTYCGYEISTLKENMTLNIIGRVCGGKLTEDDKALANRRLDIKICRKCNARLSIRATHCRKRACGYSNKLRLKKKLKENAKK